MNSQKQHALRAPLDVGEAASALFTGFRMMVKPGLRSLVIIPLILNAIILTVLLTALGSWIQGWVDVLAGWLPDWLNWLTSLLKFTIWLAALLVFGLLFTVTANIVGAPFYGFLAARAEAQLTGNYPESELSVMQEASLAIATEFRKLWYWLWRAALLGILSLLLMFIPGINMLVPVIWFVFGAWMLSLEYMDYPASNHGLDFKNKRAWLRSRKTVTYGFGSSVALITMIPVVNMLVPPAAVLGATQLWIKSQNQSSPAATPSPSKN